MDKANRPHIFCHMETSLDGKIMGKYLWIEETNAEEDSFYTLFSGPKAYFKPQALLNGRTTVETSPFIRHLTSMKAPLPSRPEIFSPMTARRGSTSSSPTPKAAWPGKRDSSPISTAMKKLRSSKSCRNRRRMLIKPTCATRASAI